MEQQYQVEEEADPAGEEKWTPFGLQTLVGEMLVL